MFFRETEMDLQDFILAKDYWQLSVGGCTNEENVLVSGRRRISERFWDPLELTITQFAKLIRSLDTAMWLVGRGGINESRPIPPMFPSAELLAAQQGTGFWLEVNESMVSQEKATTAITVFRTKLHVQPALYLIDDEVAQCHADLLKFQLLLTDAVEAYDSSQPDHPAMPVDAAVRDAATPA